MYDLGARNNYYSKEDIFSSNRYGGYLVTRLTGIEVDDVKNLIDLSTQIQNDGLEGIFLLNNYSEDFHYSSYFENTNTSISNLGYEVEFNTTGFVRHRYNLSGYVSWGSNAGCGINCKNSSAWNLSFNPGALAETLVSTSARTFEHGYDGTGPYGAQSLISDLIKYNVTGVKGYVYEPSLGAVAKVDILWGRYLKGYNLADSYYMASTKRDWMDVVVGDPKTYIKLDTIYPSLTIVSPLNGERVNNGTNITITPNPTRFSDINTVWYSVNGGGNTTLTSPYTIDTSSWTFDNYTINFYVNDTSGRLGSRSFEIIINETIGETPNYLTFDGNETTNIKILKDKTNVSDLILHKDYELKIDFFENINVSGLNLDELVDSRKGKVSINSSLAPELNKSANITFYNNPAQGFVNPFISRDGERCNPTTNPPCYNFTPLDAETVIFNVTGFSTYAMSGSGVEDCMNFTSSGEYILQNNIETNDTCFRIQANNVTIDLNGYNITGGGTGKGVLVDGYNNSIIKDGEIYNFTDGVSLKYNLDNTLTNITANSNDYGIYFFRSSNNTLTNITANENNYGIYLNSESNNNTLTNITANENNYGIYHLTSSSNTLANIITNENSVLGIFSKANFGDTLTNITANSNAGSGIYISSNNNTLTNITANSNAGSGIYIKKGLNNKLININTNKNTNNGIAIGEWGFSKTTINNTLTNITANENNYGIYLNSESNNNTLTDITANENNVDGVFIYGSSNNQLTNIETNLNIENGIKISSELDFSINSNNNTLTNITANKNNKGIYFTNSSDNNSLKNANMILNQDYGVYITAASGNNIENSLFKKNIRAVYDDDTNNYYSNEFLRERIPLSPFLTKSRDIDKDEQTSFNFTLNNINGSECPSCSYDLNLYPSEDDFEYSKDGAIITGNFTPSKTGVYSLKINITDSNNNSQIRKYVYLVNSTTDIVNYYFRSINPIHGQPTTYGSETDAGSLLFEIPSSPEEVWCGSYIGFSIDDLPSSGIGIFKDINYSVWYKTDVTSNNYTGITRFGDVNGLDVDYNASISATTKTFETFNFSTDWVSDYLWDWYYIT
ncbi:MAG: TIGR03790 family protein, partial [Candidatus Nanoarchaeia archaeon]